MNYSQWILPQKTVYINHFKIRNGYKISFPLWKVVPYIKKKRENEIVQCKWKNGVNNHVQLTNIYDKSWKWKNHEQMKKILFHSLSRSLLWECVMNIWILNEKRWWKWCQHVASNKLLLLLLLLMMLVVRACFIDFECVAWPQTKKTTKNEILFWNRHHIIYPIKHKIVV